MMFSDRVQLLNHSFQKKKVEPIECDRDVDDFDVTNTSLLSISWTKNDNICFDTKSLNPLQSKFNLENYRFED